ncbi:MAG TPA: alpha/beta hydrolase [Chloroflexota bacterium]|nr:alpha/beta hydrolase [Chloroflexota bacterium]
MPFFIKGDVSLYYEVHGSGFPLLLLPPGGMNAQASWWQRAAFNPIEIFSREYMVVAMDERNAGQSSGPLDLDDPWGMFASDQLALMNHLGIERFHTLGCCIGGAQVLKLAQAGGERVVSAVLEQPVGVDENNKAVLPNMWKEWATQLTAKRPEITMEMCETFGRKMWEGEFVLCVTRDWVRQCQTPLLVLPGIDLPHPTAIGREVHALAPNSEILEPWKEPADLMPKTVERIRQFLKKHTPR